MRIAGTKIRRNPQHHIQAQDIALIEEANAQRDKYNDLHQLIP